MTASVLAARRCCPWPGAGQEKGPSLSPWTLAVRKGAPAPAESRPPSPLLVAREGGRPEASGWCGAGGPPSGLPEVPCAVPA